MTPHQTRRIALCGYRGNARRTRRASRGGNAPRHPRSRLSGASPEPLPFPHLYQALRTGKFEARENPVRTIVAAKFNEQARRTAPLAAAKAGAAAARDTESLRFRAHEDPWRRGGQPLVMAAHRLGGCSGTSDRHRGDTCCYPGRGHKLRIETR